MNFISITFAAFFIVVVLLLRFAPSRILRQALLLVASLGFYAAFKPVYLLILLMPICIDFFCAIQIEQRAGATARKFWLAAGVISNLALLGYFKYANFFLSNVAGLLHTAPRHLDIVLPLGISFFTLKSLSYIIDVYRGDFRACRSLWRYALYVSYFPDLIAGPIVRASTFLPQLDRSLRPSFPHAVVGCHMILLGLTKKLLIADQMAIFVDPVFAAPATYSALTVWSAVIAYSLQIYCDFSGYSDLAIGASKIIGIDLPENFNMPYLATSPIDFWRRWHITLSKWLRDYLYFSLPPRRSKPWQRYRNVVVTFLLCGLWHGASWTFVGWGALHGVALAANHWWISGREAKQLAPGSFIGARFARWLAMYVFICITWVLFRAPSSPIALQFLRKMAGLASGGVAFLYSPLILVLPLVIAAHAIGIMAERNVGPLVRAQLRAWFQVRSNRLAGVYVLLRPGFLGAFLITSWALVLLLFGATGASPFVYFRF
ncbi:MAG TPA: MBOAT family O-acyltransferase [Bryobacteraceae bacterium]|nr:MBOAT family O-acyltransferase [Bryobacteraceae bacterium]